MISIDDLEKAYTTNYCQKLMSSFFKIFYLLKYFFIFIRY